jgi:hypothetical protein
MATHTAKRDTPDAGVERRAARRRSPPARVTAGEAACGGTRLAA